MSRDDLDAGGDEPERYELAPAPPTASTSTGATFFRVLGGGLVVVSAAGAARRRRSRAGRARPGAAAAAREIGAWLHIGEDGAVTAYTGKVEVGQNIRTSLTQAVAEELRAPLESVRLVMGDTA